MLTLVPGGVPGAHKGSAKVIFTIITINREKTLRKGNRGRTRRFLPSSSWASLHIWRGLLPVQCGIQTLRAGIGHFCSQVVNLTRKVDFTCRWHVPLGTEIPGMKYRKRPQARAHSLPALPRRPGCCPVLCLDCLWELGHLEGGGGEAEGARLSSWFVWVRQRVLQDRQSRSPETLTALGYFRTHRFPKRAVLRFVNPPPPPRPPKRWVLALHLAGRSASEGKFLLLVFLPPAPSESLTRSKRWSARAE